MGKKAETLDHAAEAEIVPLLPAHDLTAFICGTPTLDAWLQTRARANQESGDSRTFVALDGGQVIGFHALTTASVARASVPGSLRRNAPEPVPLLLLGQLAVRFDHHGRGLGRALLRDACLRAVAASAHVGFRALATHPLDDAAAAFYARFGFTAATGTTPKLMLLPIQRLAAAAAARG